MRRLLETALPAAASQTEREDFSRGLKLIAQLLASVEAKNDLHASGGD